jgi:hypothetical protein
MRHIKTCFFILFTSRVYVLHTTGKIHILHYLWLFYLYIIVDACIIKCFEILN